MIQKNNLLIVIYVLKRYQRGVPGNRSEIKSMTHFPSQEPVVLREICLNKKHSK